jgi:hypothetical protein
MVRLVDPLRSKESDIINLLQVFSRRFDVDLRHGV